jgi:hypothetical protein
MSACGWLGSDAFFPSNFCEQAQAEKANPNLAIGKSGCKKQQSHRVQPRKRNAHLVCEATFSCSAYMLVLPDEPGLRPAILNNCTSHYVIGTLFAAHVANDKAGSWALACLLSLVIDEDNASATLRAATYRTSAFS